MTDPDNLDLGYATVEISEAGIAGGTFAGGGALPATCSRQRPAPASRRATIRPSETLTLTGTDTLAHYQPALDSVTFTSGPEPEQRQADPTRT